MKKVEMKLPFLILSLMATLASCNGKESALKFNDGSASPESPTPKPIVVGPNDQVTYKIVKEAVIDNKCIRCHNAKRAKGRVDLSTYKATLSSAGKHGKVVVVNDSNSSTFYQAVAVGEMPPLVNLTQDEINLIKKWIDTGAKEGGQTTGTPATPVVDFKTLDVDYVNLKKYVLDDNCISCHNAKRAKGGVDLSSYKTMFGDDDYGKIVDPGKPDNSDLYYDISNGDMPPRGDTLTKEEIDYVKRWIEQGAIEKKVKKVNKGVLQLKASLPQTPATYTNVLNLILNDRCVRCHNSRRNKGGVDLSTYQSVFGTSRHGNPVTVKGNPNASGIYVAVFNGDMPPRGDLLTQEEIDFIKRWIQEGAVQ